jgi:hypothetical protein
MHKPSRIAATTLAALLAGCGGGNLQNSSASAAVPLLTAADALRELGNAAAAARLAQAPLPGACSSGADNIVGPASKPRSFVYFSNFSGSVTYETHNYSACVDGGLTYDGVLESGATADGAYAYAVRGSSTAVLLIRSTVSSGGATLDAAQSQVGTVETHVSGTQTELRSGLESRTEQTPQGASSPSYKSAMAIGVDGPTFDVLDDSSGNGGNGSETLAGAYSYSSSLCSGGSAAVTTPSALLLQASTDGSYHYPAGGSLSISSGNSAVTYSFSASGAALSGSVSGSLSSSQVQQAFNAGSGC